MDGEGGGGLTAGPFFKFKPSLLRARTSPNSNRRQFSIFVLFYKTMVANVDLTFFFFFTILYSQCRTKNPNTHRLRDY